MVSAKWVSVLAICVCLQAGSPAAPASRIAGTVTDAAGVPAANVTVRVRSAAGGSAVETKTDAQGRYSVPNLASGDYEISASTSGGPTATAQVTVAASDQTVDLHLAPAGAPGQLSVGDLGFSPEVTKGSAEEQRRLDRRSHMLKMHQRLGLITAAPLIATLLTANGAAEKRNTGSSSGRQLHATLGSITAGMYLTTASFAVFAPKAPPGTKVRGPIRLHRMLAWVHGPGMILTPILGALAYQQRSRGERVHGIAQAHAPAAVITSIAYGLAIASVSIKF